MRLLELKQPNIIVVYGGGFQPFHEGHMSSYRQAKAAFPGASFFVAASNVTSERPFEFKEKQFLAQQAGVKDPFVQVGTMSYVNDNGRKVTSTPLNPLEVLKHFNPERDVLVIVRSERDPMKTTDVSYYQPWHGVQGTEPFSKHAYIYVTKKHDFSIAGNPVYSGSQVRELYTGGDDNTKMEILQDLYPQSRQLKKIKQIFDRRLAVAESSLNEFAPPGGGDDGFNDDTLKQLAAQWFNGDEDPRVEQILAAAGWEIGQDEGYDNEPGVFVVQSGDENGNSYMSWSADELRVTEASLSTMRDYFAGDENARDPYKITQQRLWFDKNKTASQATHKKEFRSQWDYEQWLKKQKVTPITNKVKEELDPEQEAANLLEYLRKIHKRWAIVSKKEGRPLVYFKGEGKPSADWVERQERRIRKHKKK